MNAADRLLDWFHAQGILKSHPSVAEDLMLVLTESALNRGLVSEQRQFESIRNGDLAEALEAMIAAYQTTQCGCHAEPEATDCDFCKARNAAMDRARTALSGECPKCGGSKVRPLPKHADACNCPKP